MEEAVAALSLYGLTLEQLNTYWRNSKTRFDNVVKHAFIYLVTGVDPNPLVGLPQLPVLGSSQQPSIPDAINELLDLNHDQIEILKTEYIHGLRSQHLRTFIALENEDFSKEHKWAISALMHKAIPNLSAEQAIERINGKTSQEASELWHQTINSTWYQMTK